MRFDQTPSVDDIYRIIDEQVYWNGYRVPQCLAGRFSPINAYYFHDHVHVFFQDHLIEDADPGSFRVINDCYASDSHGVFHLMHVIEGADPDSFMILSEKFTKDSDQVFFEGRLVQQCDPASVEIIGSNFARDKNAVYYLTEPMPTFNRDTFYVLDGDFGSDGKHVCYGSRWLPTADPGHFIVLNPSAFTPYGKDHDSVYFGSDRLADVNPRYFTVIDDYHGTDGVYVYYGYRLIAGATADNFQNLNLNYDKDISSVFYRHQSFAAHPQSFQVLSNAIGMDRDNVYYGARIIENADPTSFEVIDHFWSKDRHHVYLKDTMDKRLDVNRFALLGGGYAGDDEHVLFEGEDLACDAATFRQLSDGWSRDDHNLFYLGQRLKDGDPASFEKLNSTFYRDKQQVYRCEHQWDLVEIVPQADAATYQILSEHHSRDALRVYYDGKIIIDADPSRFEILSYPLGKDDKDYYFGSRPMHADVATFRSIAQTWSTDIHGVFYLGERLPGSDGDSFEILTHDYCIDKIQVYYRGKIVTEAVPTGFEVLNLFFAKDTCRVYHHGQSLELDPAMLTVVNVSYAMDNTAVYFLGHRLPMKAEEFQVLAGENLCRDNDTVYHRERPIPGADPDTFKQVNYGTCQDRNFIYEMSQGQWHPRTPRDDGLVNRG